jgi:hypothetical protein
MWKCSIYLLILLFNSFYTFSQDVTVKKDTLNKLTDIIEVNSPDDEYAKLVCNLAQESTVHIQMFHVKKLPEKITVTLT